MYSHSKYDPFISRIWFKFIHFSPIPSPPPLSSYCYLALGLAEQLCLSPVHSPHVSMNGLLKTFIWSCPTPAEDLQWLPIAHKIKSRPFSVLFRVLWDPQVGLDGENGIYSSLRWIVVWVKTSKVWEGHVVHTLGYLGFRVFVSVWLLLYVLGMGMKSFGFFPFLQWPMWFEDQFYSKISLKSKDDFHGPMTYATA